jgi:hypothetical protein
MKNPTAMELWNFLMIIVPPILRAISMMALQILMNPSEIERVPVTANDMIVNTPVTLRMLYLNNADQMKKDEEPVSRIQCQQK